MSDRPSYIVGIDPGAKGSVAILPVWERKRLWTLDLDKNSIHSIFQELGALGGSTEYFLENPGYMPRSSSVALGMAKLARSVGQLEAIIQCLGRTPTLVQPRIWQGALNCRTKGDKNVSKERAIALYGKHLRITHINADAVLIAHYGWTLYG